MSRRGLSLSTREVKPTRDSTQEVNQIEIQRSWTESEHRVGPHFVVGTAKERKVWICRAGKRAMRSLSSLLSITSACTSSDVFLMRPIGLSKVLVPRCCTLFDLHGAQFGHLLVLYHLLNGLEFTMKNKNSGGDSFSK